MVVLREARAPCGRDPFYTGAADALWKTCNSAAAPPAANVNELIAAGIDLRYKTSWNKETALIEAAYRGHASAVKAIVDADPDPDHIRMKQVG